jgi:outer membrane protein assembly factor BamD
MMKRLTILLFALILLSGCSSFSPVSKKAETEEGLFNEAMNLYRKKLFYDCIPLFQNVKDKFPLSPYAIQSELRIADSNYLLRNYLEAIYQYEEFRKLHPANALVPYVIYQTGLCHFKQLLTVDRDQTETEKAVDEFEFLISKYPQSPYTGMALSRIKYCNQRIAEHEFIIGNYYLKTQNYRGAIDRFTFVLQEHPFDTEKDKVLFHLGKAYMLTNNKPDSEKVFSTLFKQFPNSLYAREARILLGIATEKEKEESKKEKEKADKKFILF